jgi:hypothetical protein
VGLTQGVQSSRPAPAPIQTAAHYSLVPQGNSHVFLTNLFTDKNEQHIFTFGNEQYIKFLNEGKSKKAFAVLSDKRLYVRGKRYEAIGDADSRGNATRAEKVIDMKDIKAVIMGRVGFGATFIYGFYAVLVSALALGATIYFFAYINAGGFGGGSAPIVDFILLAIFLLPTVGAVLLWIAVVSSLNSCISFCIITHGFGFPLKNM